MHEATPSLTPDPTGPGTEGKEMREAISRAMCVAFSLQPDLKHYGKAPDGSSCGIAEAGPDVPEHLRSTPRHWHRGWRRFAHVTDALIAGPLARLHSDLTAAREERDTLREQVAKLEETLRWRPIETAPKDGTVILGGKWHGAAWALDTTRWEVAGSTIGESGWWQMRQIPPTHWMPTPPRPALSSSDPEKQP